MPVDGNTLLAEGDLLPGDFWIEKDTIVLYSAYAMGRMEELWPDPLAFNPNRFLGEPPKPYTYLPFHGGPRVCLGMDLAYTEVRVALAVLLRRFKFTVHPGFHPDMRMKVLLSSSNGMCLDVAPRVP